MCIRDSLYGVVAYEMSDSFPIEALKAQAVAARTYAMQRKYASGGRDYDVVDTTADQVFYGYDAEYQNVIAAVDGTRGVVGTYNGTFAGCYYTASNGGQIATPNDIWGGDGDYGYIERKDDPYDLENPYSPVSYTHLDVYKRQAQPKPHAEQPARANGDQRLHELIAGVLRVAPRVDPDGDSILHIGKRVIRDHRRHAAHALSLIHIFFCQIHLI